MTQATQDPFAFGVPWGEFDTATNGAALRAEGGIVDTELHIVTALPVIGPDRAGQVQRASDTSKGCAARLAGIANPSFPDEEKTFADLQARIDKTIAFLQSVKPEQIDGSENKPVELKAGSTTINFTGESYLLGFVIPNFFFHVTTGYDILRHKGVALGKMDYLGRFE